MRRCLVLASVLLLCAATAAASDDVLLLRSGRIVTGKILSTNSHGVTIRMPVGTAQFDWDVLAPQSVYEVRAARIDPTDAAAHVRLARYCVKNALYSSARREIATARGLGYADGRMLDALLETANESEAHAAFSKARALAAKASYEKAIEVLRRYILVAPESRYTKKAHALAADLLERMGNAKEQEERRAKEARAAAEARKVKKEEARLTAEIGKAWKLGLQLYGDGMKYQNVGNVTLSHRNYSNAASVLLRGRNDLLRLQRIFRRGKAFDAAWKRQRTFEAKLVQVYLGLAHLFIDQRNYKSGIVYVRKALYLDPVNREALNLRTFVQKNWIQLSARQLTNTPSVRVTGN